MRETHPLLRRAADGILPGWARIGEERRAHVRRVVDVLDGWAERLHLGEPDAVAWRAAGYLHDSVRDAPEQDLRALLLEAAARPSSGGWGVDWAAFDRVGASTDSGSVLVAAPGPVLHGPAAAVLLGREGVEDRRVLAAVAYHTVGHPDLGDLGRALACADYLEPGRTFARRWRAGLRERFPDEPDGVWRKILSARLRYLLERDRPIFLGTVRLWNRLAP